MQYWYDFDIEKVDPEPTRTMRSYRGFDYLFDYKTEEFIWKQTTDLYQTKQGIEHGTKVNFQY